MYLLKMLQVLAVLLKEFGFCNLTSPLLLVCFAHDLNGIFEVNQIVEL